MELQGNITIDDHLNVKSMMKYDTGLLNLFTYIGVILMGMISVLLGYLFDQNIGILIALSVFVFICFSYLPLYKILTLYSIKIFKKNAEIHNIGNSVFRIEGDSIRFTGTTFNCDIPFRSIKSAKILNGTGYISFGNFCGFIVPKDNKGGLSEFINEVNNRINIG